MHSVCLGFVMTPYTYLLLKVTLGNSNNEWEIDDDILKEIFPENFGGRLFLGSEILCNSVCLCVFMSECLSQM